MNTKISDLDVGYILDSSAENQKAKRKLLTKLMDEYKEYKNKFGKSFEFDPNTSNLSMI